MPAPTKYPPELRQRVVAEVFASGRPIAQVARDLGIHKEALRLWVRRARADAVPGPARVLPSDVEAELRALRKENAELRRANVILKEASVLFASELDPDPATVSGVIDTLAPTFGVEPVPSVSTFLVTPRRRKHSVSLIQRARRSRLDVPEQVHHERRIPAGARP